MTYSLASLRSFAHRHDDMPAFHAGFLVLTVIIAAMFNLGAFGMLIFAHMALDIVKYRERHSHSWKLTIEGVIRESLLDITLLLIGLVFSVYLHHSVMVAGISGLMRAELGIVRGLATFLPKLKILHNFLKIVSHLHHYLEQKHPHLGKGWTLFDRLCFLSVATSIVLLMLTPTLMNVDGAVVAKIITWELTPWNF